MKLDYGRDTLQTYAGLFFSVLLFIFVSFYAAQKVDILINKKDVDVLSVVNKNFYDSKYIFDYSKGFNVAVAFTSYESQSEYILDPTYGRLVFEKVSWGVDETGSFFTNYEEMDKHVCTKEELGHGDPEGLKFLPVETNSVEVVEQKQKQFLCVSEKVLSLNGNF